ncbi:helix-turn-helix domain-containing protein [Hyphococcus lacteus]|uniref:Helix-turn-helix domain-containing protein n=1 Tax=Hyphococcus lacteus TaxID=3143536 RepID=A0ABV3Z4Q4_9PROT
MSVWKYSTSAESDANSVAHWREAMSRINLPVESVVNPANFRGSIISRESPLGIKISVVDAEPQKIAGKYGNQANAIWLAAMIEGEAELDAEAMNLKIGPRDIVYGRTGGKQAALAYATPYKQIFITAPPLVIDPRLISPVALQLGCIRMESSIARIFSSLLLEIAKDFETMDTSELRPIELSLAELLISCIMAEGGEIALGGAAANRTAHLNRIQQTIETFLGDPALDTKYIADREGVSIRYLQKLFSSSGQTIATYIRMRRLERCKDDLQNPAFDNLSITQICFRWGFSSSAHFSRAFRDQFGVSPREFRKNIAPLGEA